MKTRKIFAVILAAVMFLMSFPTVFAAAEYDENGATKFVFSDDGITVTEGEYSGYKAEGCDLTLNNAGTYIVSGECADGSITVKKGTTGVTLVLDGLTLENTDTAPIACNKSTEVKIVAADLSTNTLKDSVYNNDDIYPDNANAENAVIKCKDGSRVTICGNGTLNVYSEGKNGIKSGSTTEEEGEACLTVRDVELYVSTTVNDAISAEQELNILSGNITVDSADDGVKSDMILNIGALGTEGPTINVIKSYEGIEAAILNIYSGNITVHSEDDCVNAANSDLGRFDFEINIYGGNIYLTNETGDGLDSNGTINISGGKLVVWTPSTADNQPIDADGLITITGGTIFAAGGSSGMPISVTATQGYVVFGRSSMGGFRPGQPGGGFRPGQPGGPGDDQPGGDSLNIAAGSTITIRDEAGNVLHSEVAYCRTMYVFFSCPSISGGSNYSIYSDDTNIATATAQGGEGGTLPGESELPPEPPSSEFPPEPPTDDPNPPVPPTTDVPDDTDTYTVKFLDRDGNVISEQRVPKGSAAEAPDAPEYDYWVFFGWDVDFTNVSEDMTIKPVYYKKGDLNMNGDIEAADATLILRIIVSADKPAELETLLCDLNGNKTPDSGDATIVLRHVVGAEILAY